MAVTTKKTFPATSNSTTDTFGPIGIELNNQDDLDVYITLSGGTRVLQYKQTSASTTDSNHPQVNDTTGLYFPPVSAGVALKNYTISADNNNVIFNSALPSGAVVSVERRTRDSSSSYTSFSGGSTIRSTDLNRALDETRFTAQEGRNKAFDLERQTFSEDGNIRLLEDQSLIYEGATDDAHETKLAITDPTADRTITFPDVSGNVVTTGDTGTVDATMLATNSVNSDELVADSVITAKIANDQVTYAKIQNVSATDRILGRDSAGAGDIEEITPAALRTMLNLEDGSTGDQSNAEIRAAVEAATDSNVFTDADHTKLNSVETGATADQSNAEIRAAVEAASDSNVFTDADHTKLNGIEASATADQTGAEIKAAYEGESNTNAFTDAEKSKVADAVLNADLDGKGEILVGDGSGDPTAFAASTTNGHILTIDTTEPTGMKWAANAGAGGGGSSLTVIDESTTLTTDATKLKFVGAGVTATEPSTDEITVTIPGTNTQLTEEQVEDFVGGMVTGNTETGITVTYDDSDGTLDFVVASQTDENFTTADHSKLDGIEASATADQTDAEIRAAVEAATDSNVFTDADHTKLNGIATSANNYVHPNHSGEVTSTADGATVIASDIVDEDNLKISNAGSNGQFLQKQSGNTGGLTWASVVGSITALNNQGANRLTTIGSTTTELDGEASLTFEDTTSTGLISSKQVTARGFECPATVSDDWTIAAGNNAFFPGPMTVAANKTVTVPANRTLTIV